MIKIHIVGLGPGSLENLSLGAYEKLLSQDKPVFLRTKRHPNVALLEERGMKAEYLDAFYERGEDFEQVYSGIAEEILSQAKERGEIVYAVPGHPCVAEKTVELILRGAEKIGAEVEIQASMSFIDASFSALRRDPLEGFILLDATAMEEEEIDPRKNLLITQIYDRYFASEVKLKLLEIYEEDQEVFLMRNIGSGGQEGEERIERIPLWEMDHASYGYDHLTTLFVPRAEEGKKRQIRDLVEIIRRLRGEGGCPWDRKQTHESLRRHIVEEAEEVRTAIENEDVDNLIEELGDVLMQVIFHSELGRASGEFSLGDIVQGICEKMIFRHPHVFSGLQIEEKDLAQLWEKLKKEEKKQKNIEK